MLGCGRVGIRVGTTVADSAPFAGKAILIVDDDTYYRKIIRSLLTSFGVKRIYEAGDGAQALEVMQQFRPDVVIVDLEMPMLNGTEMIKLVRNPQSSSHATVPIILATGHTERGRIQEAIALGVNAILVKPFSAKTLLQRLDFVVNHPRPFVHAGGYFGPMQHNNALLEKTERGVASH